MSIRSKLGRKNIKGDKMSKGKWKNRILLTLVPVLLATSLVITGFSAAQAAIQPALEIAEPIPAPEPTPPLVEGAAKPLDQKVVAWGATPEPQWGGTAGSGPAADMVLVPAILIHVLDGDTIYVDIDGRTEVVRFIGIDTTETLHPWREIQMYAFAATAFVEEKIYNRQVWLQMSLRERCFWGRLLAYVWVEQPTYGVEAEVRSLMLNAILLLEGYATVLAGFPSLLYTDMFMEFQREALEANRGLWGALTAGLKDEDPEVRMTAIKTLWDIGYPSAGLDLLITALLYDEYWKVRGRAAIALGRIGDPRAIEPLIVALLEDECPEVRGWSAWALNRPGLRDPRAREALLPGLRDEDPAVRMKAVITQGRLGSPLAIPAIAPLADVLIYDEDREVRMRAAIALGLIRHQQAVEPLIAALMYDEYVPVRRQAAWALGRIGDEQAVEPLIAVLKDKDAWLRAQVADALGRIGDQRAIKPLLITMLVEEDRLAILAMRRALRVISDLNP